MGAVPEVIKRYRSPTTSKIEARVVMVPTSIVRIDSLEIGDDVMFPTLAKQGGEREILNKCPQEIKSLNESGEGRNINTSK